MTWYQDDDPLLRALREARPAMDDARLSPDAPQATALLGRILGGGQATPVTSLASRTGARSHRRRPRSRRRAAWTVASGAAAAALAVAALAGTGAFRGSAHASAGRSGSHPAPTLDVRTIAKRASAALTQAGATKIGYTLQVVVTSAGVVNGSTAFWSYPALQGPYGRQYRFELLDTDGRPLLDNSTVTSDGRTAGRDVDYPSRSYSTFTDQAQTPQPGQSVMDSLLQEVKAGQYHIIGRPVVDGVPTLELSGAHWAPASGFSPAGTAHDTVWISADSYLPLQEMTTFPSGEYIRTTTKLLAPTPANLAQLQAPIPAGFTEKPPGQ